jgi:hypothetical protein
LATVRVSLELPFDNVIDWWSKSAWVPLVGHVGP